MLVLVALFVAVGLSYEVVDGLSLVVKNHLSCQLTELKEVKVN